VLRKKEIIMRSILVFIITTLLTSSFAYANTCNAYPYQNLIVVISNTGSEDCRLINKSISKGKLLSPIPSVISADAYTFHFSLGGKGKKGVISEAAFTYQCGMNKKFTLHLKNIVKPKHLHTSASSEIIDAIDVFSKISTTQGLLQFQGQKCQGTSPKTIVKLSN
jgi:hypothetical protein